MPKIINIQVVIVACVIVMPIDGARISDRKKYKIIRKRAIFLFLYASNGDNGFVGDITGTRNINTKIANPNIGNSKHNSGVK